MQMFTGCKVSAESVPLNETMINQYVQAGLSILNPLFQSAAVR